MQPLYIDPDISRAATLPATFYSSPEWFALSKEKIFAKSWQFCLGNEVFNAEHSLVPFTLLPGFLSEPLLFVQDEKTLRCLSNVCTHRANLLVNAPCKADKIKCGYHGRRFNLCGEMLHMPEFSQTQNFPSPTDNLPSIPCEQLNPFIFVSLDPKISFQDTFMEMKERLYWLPWEELRFDSSRSRDYEVKAHWALYCENYLEALHIPFVHPSLRENIDCTTYTTEIYNYSNLQLALAKDDEEHFNIPPGARDYGKKVAAYYYWIFPNTMLNFYPWGCSVNVVKPIHPELTQVSFYSYVLDASKLGKGAGGALDQVELEDEAVVESVQQGIKSRFYHAGRFSPTKEQGTHHFQRLLCEFLKD
ncbi:MAG: aromatic ring-hydroxylating dioxygenase subunit alpha [Legionella sp.]|nr:MAG: aromatic ring-hydroxylating dioxygenase subunit alpha [Legionella sp.]